MPMRTDTLAGRQVPAIGQGTYLMEQDDPADVLSALRRGLDLGMSHIDTAEMYGAGRAEELVGQAIAGRRNEVFLVSKVLPSNASRSGVVAACEASLRRLGTDHLDLYLLHWPSGHAFAETLAGFEALADDGKIRAFGVSNFDTDELEEARSLAGPKLACNQVAYHLGERTIERRVAPWCREHGIPVVGYSPYGQGRFPPNDVLARIAEERGATGRQVALAFLTREPSTFAIPKSSNAEHVQENAGAATLELSAGEIDALDTAFPLGPDRGLPFW
jgi:diketogulonate reductase-like aldo/keto reductase